MSKKYNLRIIKTKRSYTFREIADLLGVHARTVQSWHLEGLHPLEGSNNPYLVMGGEIKMYLKQKIQKNKVTLKSNEFYCVKCRKAVIPLNIYKYVNGVIGGFKPSVRLEGLCPICNGKVNKFTSKEALPVEDSSKTIWALEHPREDLH